MPLPNDLHARAMRLARITPPGTLVGFVTRAIEERVQRLEAEEAKANAERSRSAQPKKH